MDSLREVAQNAECVAIGECGLDFNRNFSPPDVQLDVFEKQVQQKSSLNVDHLDPCKPITIFFSNFNLLMIF